MARSHCHQQYKPRLHSSQLLSLSIGGVLRARHFETKLYFYTWTRKKRRVVVYLNVEFVISVNLISIICRLKACVWIPGRFCSKTLTLTIANTRQPITSVKRPLPTIRRNKHTRVLVRTAHAQRMRGSFASNTPACWLPCALINTSFNL